VVGPDEPYEPTPRVTTRDDDPDTATRPAAQVDDDRPATGDSEYTVFLKRGAGRADRSSAATLRPVAAHPDDAGRSPLDPRLATLPRHRHGLSREDVRASQSARILQATATVVAERGFAAATVIEIARRAGVSRKTFYELFADKEDAFDAAHDAVTFLIEPTVAALADTGSFDGGPDAIATAGTAAFLSTLAAHPPLTRMVFLEGLGAGPRVRLRRDEAIEQFAAVVAPHLARLRTAFAPELEPVDHALARALIDVCFEAIVRHLIHHEPETLGQMTPELAALARRIVIPLPAAA
jgi:AcrR family transcriptional regulator